MRQGRRHYRAAMPLWDPALEELRPATQEFSRQLAATLALEPPMETVDPAITRRNRAEGNGPFPAPVRLDHAETRTIAGVPVRVVVPEEVRGVYLHLHGGGWVLGSADGQDLLLDRVANAAGVAVVSVDYRLAPEDPYPAAPDDCEAVALWLAEHAGAAWGAHRLLIGGESAGAHLGATTLLRLRDRHDALAPFVGANLIYGLYDLSGTPSQRAWTKDLVLSPTNLAWFVDCFVGPRPPEERRDPDISPLYADLAGMPPAIFSAGTDDPLLDDTLFMAARWRAAGGGAELHVYPDAPHSFTLFPTEMAARCNERIDRWIAARVR